MEPLPEIDIAGAKRLEDMVGEYNNRCCQPRNIGFNDCNNEGFLDMILKRTAFMTLDLMPRIVPLRTLMGHATETELEKFLSAFRDDRSDGLMGAIESEYSGIMRTYLAVESSGLILGCFSIGSDTLRFSDDVVIPTEVRMLFGIGEGSRMMRVGRMFDFRISGMAQEFAPIIISEAMNRLRASSATEKLIVAVCSDDYLPLLEERGFHTIMLVGEGALVATI